MSDALPACDNLPEQKLPADQHSWNQLELTQRQTEVERILGQNHSVKKEMARQLHAAGIPMEVIGRILNLRVKIIKENITK